MSKVLARANAGGGSEQHLLLWLLGNVGLKLLRLAVARCDLEGLSWTLRSRLYSSWVVVASMDKVTLLALPLGTGPPPAKLQE